MLDVDEEPAFDVTVDVRRYPTEVAPLSTVGETGDEEPCGPLELNICAKYGTPVPCIDSDDDYRTGSRNPTPTRIRSQQPN